MAEPEYPDDIQFAGLVQAATAAADEQSRTLKRKCDEENVQLRDSAAILFREPSVKSKKYSRPPLGKVYSSLGLAPENFLRLQSAGKNFMLDPDHPDRRDVVGHRKHSGGNDVAKLKLWNCVEEFLRDAGNGERFFGHGVGDDIPGAPAREIFWPEDVQKIIKLCMPLMRKMVTNERQRVYAAESRKTGPEGKEKSPKPLAENGDVKEPKQKLQHTPNVAPEKTGVVLHVNLMTKESGNSKRVFPRFSLSPEKAANLASLMNEIQNRLKKKTDLRNAVVKVWMADGLVPVTDDGEWMVALLSAGTVEWMDGEVRIVVEV